MDNITVKKNTPKRKLYCECRFACFYVPSAVSQKRIILLQTRIERHTKTFQMMMMMISLDNLTSFFPHFMIGFTQKQNLLFLVDFCRSSQGW